MSTPVQAPRKIIFLNGPPRAGKDQAGVFIRKHFFARLYKMSQPMKSFVPAFFQLNHEQQRTLEETKDENNELLFGYTYRELQISISESWAKPLFGPHVFGHLAARYLRQSSAYEYTAITDSGFRKEAEPIVHSFGAKNCLLIRVHRAGCDFTNDSRSYIELADLGVTEADIENKFELEMYEQQCIRAVSKWIEA